MENIETIEMTYTDAIKALEIYKLNISETTLAKNDYINHISLDDYMELLMNDSHEIVIPSVSNVMLKILDYVPDLKTFSHSDYSVAAGVIDVGVADVEVHVLRTSICNKVTTIGLWIDHSRQVVYMAYAPVLYVLRVYSMEILLWWGILYINKARHNVIISWDEHRSNFIANNLDLWAKDAACIERVVAESQSNTQDYYAHIQWDANNCRYYASQNDMWIKSADRVRAELKAGVTAGYITPDFVNFIKRNTNDSTPLFFDECGSIILAQVHALELIHSTNWTRLDTETLRRYYLILQSLPFLDKLNTIAKIECGLYSSDFNGYKNVSLDYLFDTP